MSISSDDTFFTCAQLAEGSYSVMGLSDDTAWTCEYLEETYGCNCANCDCLPPANATEPEDCPATCLDGTLSCDMVIDMTNFHTNCSTLEATHGCDCTACACAEGYCDNFPVNIEGETCEQINARYSCAILRNSGDYITDCVDHGCGCTECVPGCLEASSTCDDWLDLNGVDGDLNCATLEDEPIGCDCSGCECRTEIADCSAECMAPSHLEGLQNFADMHEISSCDDWGRFFTDETFTCAYLEREWWCDCSGCECDSAPQCETQLECRPCENDVFSGTCDEMLVSSQGGISCEVAETKFACDCSGCSCELPPSGLCPDSCLGYSCDDVLPVFGGSQTCGSLEGLGFDCNGCTQCDFYTICDTYRYPFSAGFITDQPKFQAQSCDGTPFRDVGAFSFCECANQCEADESCAFFDNVGLDCRLFTAGECAVRQADDELVGVWVK